MYGIFTYSWLKFMVNLRNIFQVWSLWVRQIFRGITSVLGGLVPGPNPSVDRIGSLPKFEKVHKNTTRRNWDMIVCIYVYMYIVNVYIYIYMPVYGSNVSSVLGLERFKRRPLSYLKSRRPWVPSPPVSDDSSPTWDAKAHFGWYLFLSTSRSTFLLSFEWNLIWRSHRSGVPVRFTETVVIIPMFGQSCIISNGKTIYTILTCKYDTKIPGEHSSKFFEWFWSLLMRRKPAEPHHFFSFATVKDPKRGATLPSILEKQLQKTLRSQGCLCFQLATLKRLPYVTTYVHIYIYDNISLCTWLYIYIYAFLCYICSLYHSPTQNHVASYIFGASHMENFKKTQVLPWINFVKMEGQLLLYVFASRSAVGSFFAIPETLVAFRVQKIHLTLHRDQGFLVPGSLHLFFLFHLLAFFPFKTADAKTLQEIKSHQRLMYI